MPRSALPLIAALLLAPTLAGCSSTGADEPTRGANQQGYVGVSGSLTTVAPADRQPVPVVSGPGLEPGQTVSTADHPGRVVVINVWGSWCPPCRKEAPDLQAASEATKGTSQFVGITTKEATTAAPLAFVRSNNITYPSIFDPDGSVLLQFAGTLPPSAPPSTLILDEQGRMAVRVIGPISKTTLVTMINDVAAGR